MSREGNRGERNAGWERVRTRGKTIVRDRVSLYVDP